MLPQAVTMSWLASGTGSDVPLTEWNKSALVLTGLLAIFFLMGLLLASCSGRMILTVLGCILAVTSVMGYGTLAVSGDPRLRTPTATATLDKARLYCAKYLEASVNDPAYTRCIAAAFATATDIPPTFTVQSPDKMG